MSIALLSHIANKLEVIGIDYEFCEWTSLPVPDPYFVGEYMEEESTVKQECGQQKSVFILTGTGRSLLRLEQAKEKIERSIDHTAILSNGNGVAVSYAFATIIPTGDAELKRIQINLDVTEWSVNHE